MFLRLENTIIRKRTKQTNKYRWKRLQQKHVRCLHEITKQRWQHTAAPNMKVARKRYAHAQSGIGRCRSRTYRNITEWDWWRWSNLCGLTLIKETLVLVSTLKNTAHTICSICRLRVERPKQVKWFNRRQHFGQFVAMGPVYFSMCWFELLVVARIKRTISDSCK